jgi:hypothetical protein
LLTPGVDARLFSTLFPPVRTAGGAKVLANELLLRFTGHSASPVPQFGNTVVTTTRLQSLLKRNLRAESAD